MPCFDVAERPKAAAAVKAAAIVAAAIQDAVGNVDVSGNRFITHIYTVKSTL